MLKKNLHTFVGKILVSLTCGGFMFVNLASHAMLDDPDSDFGHPIRNCGNSIGKTAHGHTRTWSSKEAEKTHTSQRSYKIVYDVSTQKWFWSTCEKCEDYYSLLAAQKETLEKQ